MTDLAFATHWHLVGFKGVAQAALAQVIREWGGTVSGSDVAEHFVTKSLVEWIPEVQVGFAGPVPSATDVVVYTAAHGGPANPQVKAALDQGIVCVSHAEALAWFFNQKKGVAVCGVGGKSTTSAMITWILKKTGHQPSYAVGVGGIPGLAGTGSWQTAGEVFVAEADEYVTDPSAPSRHEEITPRFSYLSPQLTVCTNLVFDHPDVYRDFEHTLEVFTSFFEKVPAPGVLILNQADKEKLQSYLAKISAIVRWFGSGGDAEIVGEVQHQPGQTIATVRVGQEMATVSLQLPGDFNIQNALAAILVTTELGVSVAEAAAALQSFRSTKRRAEYVGMYQGAKLYDDYAHHPQEVSAIIHAFREWYPEAKLVVAFQSHTFSRTKALFADFVTAFGEADEVAMIDIFPSAREAFDPSVSSEQLCEAINAHEEEDVATNYGDLASLANHLQSTLADNTVCLTVGAGTIYEVYDRLKGITYD